MERKLLPPLWLLLCAALMWLIAQIPFPALPRPLWLAALLAVLGIAIAASALLTFRRAATTADPRDPAQSRVLITHGIYRLSRNPMYLGMALLLAAWAVYLAHPLAWTGIPAFILAITRWQILPEERILEAKFAASYRAYRQRTRRWL
ncbi:MAG: isoprenylcysteine carboxylmethyltransferase family protein [Cardiobacteriaceae bacterium]|nr:isoprenylcysteine carboxylmethyltransferase family protein [Cardiobacteriaceae bacterium]